MVLPITGSPLSQLQSLPQGGLTIFRTPWNVFLGRKAPPLWLAPSISLSHLQLEISGKSQSLGVCCLNGLITKVGGGEGGGSKEGRGRGTCLFRTTPVLPGGLHSPSLCPPGYTNCLSSPRLVCAPREDAYSLRVLHTEAHMVRPCSPFGDGFPLIPNHPSSHGFQMPLCTLFRKRVIIYSKNVHKTGGWGEMGTVQNKV